MTDPADSVMRAAAAVMLVCGLGFVFALVIYLTAMWNKP